MFAGLKLLLPVSAGRRGFWFPFREYKDLVYTWDWKIGCRLCPAWTLASWRQMFLSWTPMTRCCWSWSCSCSRTVFWTVSSCSLWPCVSWLEETHGLSSRTLKGEPSLCSFSWGAGPVSFLGLFAPPATSSSCIGCSDTLLILLELNSPLLKSHAWKRYSGTWYFGSVTCIERGCLLVWGSW